LRTLVLSWDQAKQFLRSRRSIRLFKDKAIDRETLEQLIETARYAPTGGNAHRETLEQLIETARYAPTGGNAQNLHWTVIEGRDKLEALSQETINWMKRGRQITFAQWWLAGLPATTAFCAPLRP
jgi:nitroreductase